MGAELPRIEEFPGHDGLFLELVGVEGGDALLGGAVFLVLQAGLLQAVQIPVPGQQQRGPVADFQVVRRDGNALGDDLLHFLPQALTVQGHAVAQDVDDAVPENAGGQQVEGKFALLVDHRVSGVAAALIADDHVVILGDQVYHTALALVAPVDAHNGAV